MPALRSEVLQVPPALSTLRKNSAIVETGGFDRPGAACSRGGGGVLRQHILVKHSSFLGADALSSVPHLGWERVRPDVPLGVF